MRTELEQDRREKGKAVQTREGSKNTRGEGNTTNVQPGSEGVPISALHTKVLELLSKPAEDTEFSEGDSYVSNMEQTRKAHGIKAKQQVFLVSLLMNNASV